MAEPPTSPAVAIIVAVPAAMPVTMTESPPELVTLHALSLLLNQEIPTWGVIFSACTISDHGTQSKRRSRSNRVGLRRDLH